MNAKDTQLAHFSVREASLVREAARTRGASTALVALAELIPIAAMPGECLLIPEQLSDAVEGHVLGHVRSDDGDLVALRAAPLKRRAGATSHQADRAWRSGAAWVRLGLCERYLEQAVAWLARRTVGGVSTLKLPSVRLAVADATLAHREAEAILAGPQPPAATGLAAVTEALDRSLGLVQNLWGAAGFVDGGPARLARTIDMLGHTSGLVSEG